MDNQQEKYERIEQYLAGTMSEAEKLAFESELQESSSLAREVERHQTAHRLLSDEKKIELRNLLETVGQEYTSTPPSNPKFSVAWRWAAALLVLVGIAASLWWLVPFSQQGDLYGEFYETYPVYSLQRQTPSENTELFDQAMELYIKKDYVSAAEKLQEVLETENEPMTRFYLGICRLELNQESKAIEQFQSIIDQGDNFFESQSQWYLALTYLKLKQPEEAEPLLQSMAKDGFHPYQAKAKAVLKKLSE